MKIVFISSITPSGHYSQYILEGLASQKNTQIILYAGKHERLNAPHIKKVENKYVWSKSTKYFVEIIRQTLKDKPDVAHLQQEFNMYGGPFTSLIFPWLVLALKLIGTTVVVTIHAAVEKKEITPGFILLFHKSPRHTKPFILWMYFIYTYYLCGLFSHTLLVHTNRKRIILIRDYYASSRKLTVIPVVIPSKKISTRTTKPYLFYFGYIVRRKGLENVLDGFARFVKNKPKNKIKLIMAGGTIAGQEEAFEEICMHIKRRRLQKRVILKGFIEEDQQDKLYTEARAVIIPAIISMGSSGPLYHATSYGKCVFASNIGYLREDIIDGETGVLIDNDEWEKVFEFTQDNIEHIRIIEKKAIKKAQTQSPRNIAKRYIALYQLLLKS